jgi:diguanylate cyclase (GGDEF)-like protein/PAS domain S-box-containing protein
MKVPKIIVVNSQKTRDTDIRKSLNKLGYSICEMTNFGEEALKKVTETNPEIVVIEICLTDLSMAVEMALYQYQIRKLEQEKQKLEAIVNSMGNAVLVIDEKSYIQMMNSVAQSLTNYTLNEAVGKNLTEVLSVVDQHMGKVIENLTTQVIETGVVLSLPENCRIITQDGTEKQIEGSLAPINDGDGKISSAVLVFQDVTQRKQAEALLLRHAYYDGLTALPNRVLFQDRLKQAFERGKRRNNYRFAVLFLDLDDFKSVNDCFGHEIGDNLLVAIARRLELCLRSCDTVARLGGDEFAVILEDINDDTDATYVAKRIEEAIKLPIYLQGNVISTTASIGVALFSNDYEQPTTLLRDADIAMYLAKKQGKARYAIFSS